MSTGYPTPSPAQTTSPLSPGAKLQFHLDGHAQPMDGRPTEYPQSGLSEPTPMMKESLSEASADQPAAAQYPQGQDPRSSNFSSSATPTSEYGINPSSARSGSFPEYIQRAQYPQGGQPANAGGMAQATSPSLPDGHANNHHPPDFKSNSDVPIDPSIAAATSPTYPHGQYSPYTPHHEMNYPGHPGLYNRPDWAGGQYPPGHGMPGYGHSPASTGPPAPPMVSPVQRPPGVRSAI